MHDYFSLDKLWYENMLKFKEPFDIMMNRIIDINGNRFHDWVINPFKHSVFLENTMKTFLPYDIKHAKKYQYISGGYWIAKKKVMEEFPLDERLIWGQACDVEWSDRVMEKYDFTINPKSIVKLIKPRFATEWSLVDEDMLKFINELKK